jgi:HEAT repeat protein
MGWLELGNPVEANEQLERIAPLLRAHPDVLEVRLQVFVHARKWEACVEVAETILKSDPDRPEACESVAGGVCRNRPSGFRYGALVAAGTNATSAIPELSRRLRADQEPWLIVPVLQSIGPASIPTLVEALDSGEVDTQVRAVFALGSFGEHAARLRSRFNE